MAAKSSTAPVDRSQVPAEPTARPPALADVLEATLDCVCSIDRAWRFTYLNARATAHFGAGDLVGRSIVRAFLGIRQSGFRQIFRRAMLDRVAGVIEGYLPERQAWYEMSATPSEDGITIFFRDITDRKLAETAQAAAAAQLRTTLDNVPQMIWAERGPDDQFFSRQWIGFTGVDPGAPGAPARITLVHPEDRERATAAWLEAQAEGKPYQVEYRLRHHSGVYRWILSRANPERDALGRVVAWYGTCTDCHEQVLARQALDRSEKRVKAILDSVPQIIWCAGPDGRVDFISNKWERLFGPSGDLVVGERWAQLLHPDDRAAAFERWRHSVMTGEPYEAEFRIVNVAGDHLWVLVQALPERGEGGAVLRWYGTCTDINARVVAEQARNASEKLSRGILEASPDCVSLLDLDGRFLSLNGPARAFYDAAGDDTALIGTPWSERLSASARPAALAAFAGASRGEVGRAVVSADSRWWDMAVAPICDDGGRPFRIVVISRDVTEQKLAEQHAHWAANHDALTGLANRALLQQRVDDAMADAAGTGGRFALLLLDVDDFKLINDSIGHDAGDALLCAFATRLREAVGPNDTVARLGGDEFAVILSGVTDETALTEVGNAILAALRDPCVHNGRLLDCHASIGASLFPAHGFNRMALLKNADVALYSAKSAGGGNLRIFRPAMRDLMQKRASMLNVARDALENDRILPHYQPKIDLQSGAVAGFEALLRWTDPLFGIQGPAMLAAAFEDLTLAAEISDRIVAGVIADMRRWSDDGVPFGHVAINAAAAEFRRGDFAEQLLARMAVAGLPPNLIQLEVTETVFLGRGAEYVERALKTLAAAGVKIALDDFGTGYASLSHLKQFPVHSIKIDRSFVRDLEVDEDDVAIIRAVANLGRSLGIQVVAEGIESPAQHDFLLGIGCDQGQGYLYGQATPAAQVPLLLAGRPASGVAVDKEDRHAA